MRPLGSLPMEARDVFLVCTLTSSAGILIRLFRGGIGVRVPIVLIFIRHAGIWDERIAKIALTVKFSFLVE